jgi:ferredoxin
LGRRKVIINGEETMIVGDRKPLEEIKSYVDGCKKILVLGCGTCVSVCMSGGEKEAQLLASQLRMAFKKENKEVQVDDQTIQRQCDKEYFDAIREKIPNYDVIVSMGCGAGVQKTAEIFENTVVVPALNTTFIGVAEKEGVWTEKCRACASCLLAETGGICPVTICPKGLVNGPCGGTNHGKCEVDKDKDCAWTLIYRRLDAQGRLGQIKEIHPAQNYQVQTTPSRRIHEAYKEEEA